MWVRTAALALENNHEVYISIYKWETVHESILALKKKGATLLLRPNELASSASFSKKAYFKLNRIFRKESFKKILDFELDVLLISQGGTYDFTWNKDFRKFLYTCNVNRMYLVNQFNNEHEILPYSDIIHAKSIFEKMTRVFFVSQRNKNVAERQIACNIQNAQIISNPIKVTYGKIPYIHSSKLSMAIVGRLDANVKGHDLLIQALSSRSLSDMDWELNVYGEGPDEGYLKELVHFYKLTDKIHFKGFEKDVRKIWELNHILVLTSFAEGTPLSLLEAMACGRTAVVTDVGGCGEFIEDGVNGFLIKAPTVDLIKTALEEMFARKSHVESMGELCLAKVQALIKDKPEHTLYDILINNI
ncbi:MAG: glycosyltransferase [Cytophaga sp.]|uniref:glycosyltransferase n=1 Tax=Cytophaga sp. TaxID=29535 RepID=UPI003F80482F